MTTYLKLDYPKHSSVSDTLNKLGFSFYAPLVTGISMIVVSIMVLSIGLVATAILGTVVLALGIIMTYFGYTVLKPVVKGSTKTFDIWTYAHEGYAEQQEIAKTFSSAIYNCEKAYDALTSLCDGMCVGDPNRPDLRNARNIVRDAHWLNVEAAAEAIPFLAKWKVLSKDSKRRLAMAADKAQMRGEECESLITSCTDRVLLDSPLADPNYGNDILEETIAIAKHWEDLMRISNNNNPLELMEKSTGSFKEMRHRSADNLKR